MGPFRNTDQSASHEVGSFSHNRSYIEVGLDLVPPMCRSLRFGLLHDASTQYQSATTSNLKGQGVSVKNQEDPGAQEENSKNPIA